MYEGYTGSVVVLFIVFLLILAAAYFTTKFISAKSATFMQGKYLRVKERIFLGRDKHVVLLQAGSRFFLIGVTNQAINLIATLEEDALVLNEEPAYKAGAFSSFGELLSRLGNTAKKENENSP